MSQAGVLEKEGIVDQSGVDDDELLQPDSQRSSIMSEDVGGGILKEASGGRRHTTAVSDLRDLVRSGIRIPRPRDSDTLNGSERTNLINTGVYAMRSTNETRRLVAQWLNARNEVKEHDQAVLNLMAYKDWVVSE